MICDHSIHCLQLWGDPLNTNVVTRFDLLKEFIGFREQTQRVNCTGSKWQLIFVSHVEQNHSGQLPARNNRGTFLKPFNEVE